MPVAAGRFTLPKAGQQDGLRILSWLDPYDEAALRTIVGRLIPAIESHRGKEVYSYRLGAQPPAWWTERHGPAISQRRETALNLLRDPGCVGVGTFDVADYYRSVDLGIAAKVVTDLGSPNGATEALLKILDGLAQLEGPGGLPIGLEASGLLANAVLYPLDAELRGRVPFLRYTDDVWVFPDPSYTWDAVVADVTDVVESLALKLNMNKVWLWDKEWSEPEEIIRNRTLDSLTAASDAHGVSPDKAFDLLDGQLSDAPVDWTVLRFALSVLGRAHDDRGVTLIEDRPEFFTEEPVAVGRYLTAIASHPPTSKRVDRDWLVERASNGDARGLAARLHACVVASHLHLGAHTGSTLFDLATAMNDQRRAPFQVWAATAWAASEDWKPSRAVDAAEHFGSLQLRRAFCLPFRGRAATYKRAAIAKQQLALIEPDLRPTLEYAFN